MELYNIKYLDPKNDLTFRKIFGEHPNIMKSFLNSIMPFEDDRYIESLSYQDPALIPELPELKHSIVDVRCTDNYGRQFIVEMQMYWTSSFKSRMLFNAGKAYVKQLDQGRKYNKLCPVYGLSLVNDEFLKEDKYKNKYYHHYKMLHNEISDEVIEGIELIFVELPKFKPKTFTEKKLRNLWLRFLTEIDENTKDVPQDMLKEQEIKEALEYLHVSAFTKEELAYYDKYWDSIRVEKSIKEDEKIKYQAEIKKKDKQIEEERKRVEEERKRAEEEKHRAEGEHKKLVVTIKLLLSSGVDIKTISEQVGISVDEIRKLNE